MIYYMQVSQPTLIEWLMKQDNYIHLQNMKNIIV